MVLIPSDSIFAATMVVEAPPIYMAPIPSTILQQSKIGRGTTTLHGADTEAHVHDAARQVEAPPVYVGPIPSTSSDSGPGW